MNPPEGTRVTADYRCLTCGATYRIHWTILDVAMIVGCGFCGERTGCLYEAVIVDPGVVGYAMRATARVPQRTVRLSYGSSSTAALSVGFVGEPSPAEVVDALLGGLD